MEAMLMTVERQFTITEVANMLRKSTRTIRRWIEGGRIKAAKMPGRYGKPSYLIAKSEVEKFGIEIKEDEPG